MKRDYIIQKESQVRKVSDIITDFLSDERISEERKLQAMEKAMSHCHLLGNVDFLTMVAKLELGNFPSRKKV